MSLWSKRDSPDVRYERIERNLRDLNEQLRAQRMLLYDILADVRGIMGLLQPRLVRIAIVSRGGNVPLEIGKTTVATVNGFDQFGQPFPIDFTVNPPVWSESSGVFASIAPDATTPSSEDVTGVTAGTEVLSVSVAGLSASLKFDVITAAPVLTSLTITTNPAV